jgi:hypothetical protein
MGEITVGGCLCLFALTVGCTANRPGALLSGSGQRAGVLFTCTTFAEPPFGSGERRFTDGGGFQTTGNRVHRFLIDGAKHRYFGYDLVLEPAGDANR